jgi:hypothetical protein
MHYTYHVNLDERGIFFADVRDENDATVYELHSDDDGYIWEVEDGFMRHAQDLAGLTDYLISMEVIPPGSRMSLEV